MPTAIAFKTEIQNTGRRFGHQHRNIRKIGSGTGLVGRFPVFNDRPPFGQFDLYGRDQPPVVVAACYKLTGKRVSRHFVIGGHETAPAVVQKFLHRLKINMVTKG